MHVNKYPEVGNASAYTDYASCEGQLAIVPDGKQEVTSEEGAVSSVIHCSLI